MNPSNGDNFTLSPAKNELLVKPGSIAEHAISLFNNSSNDLTLRLSVEDLIKDGGDNYSLKNYLEYSRTPFLLESGKSVGVPIKIVTPSDIAPGGYYATIFVSTVPDSNSQGEAKVSVGLGSHFFVTVPGQVEKSGELKDFGLITSNFIWKKGSLDFQMYFENTGNIYLNPYGQITIKHPSGLEKKILVDPWYVLPDSSRLREMSTAMDETFWPGRYSAKLELNRGYEDIVDTREFNFWFLPWWLVVFVAIIALIIILVLFRRVIKFAK